MPIIRAHPRASQPVTTVPSQTALAIMAVTGSIASSKPPITAPTRFTPSMKNRYAMTVPRMVVPSAPKITGALSSGIMVQGRNAMVITVPAMAMARAVTVRPLNFLSRRTGRST